MPVVGKLCIQCTDSVSGKTGTFLARLDSRLPHTATSPVFDGLAEFYVWRRANGWVERPLSLRYPTGRYYKEI